MLPATIKDKLFQVQEDLSSSIRNLHFFDNSFIKPGTPVAVKVESAGKTKVNLDAGADLLNYYQTAWCRMKEISESNFRLADKTDQLLRQCTSRINSTHASITALVNQLQALSVIQAQCLKITQLMGEIEVECEQVEKLLEQMEDAKQEEDLQRRIAEENYKVSCYEQEQRNKLNMIKAKLAAEHNRKVQEAESRKEQLMRERQEVFENAFKQELEQYKLLGKLPGGAKFLPTASLDEILFEDDTSALDRFLSEDSVEM